MSEIIGKVYDPINNDCKMLVVDLGGNLRDVLQPELKKFEGKIVKITITEISEGD